MVDSVGQFGWTGQDRSGNHIIARIGNWVAVM